MDDRFQQRLETLEMNFDQYMTLFYRWLDEMRTDMKLHSIEMEKHAINMERLDDNEALLVRLLRNMGDKLDDHDGRLNRAGI
jgi:hypothetical protein